MPNNALGELFKRRLIYGHMIFLDDVNRNWTTNFFTLSHLSDLSAITYVKEN